MARPAAAALRQVSVLVAVTDHAAERFRQRVAGTLDAKGDVIRRVALAWEAGASRRTTAPTACATCATARWCSSADARGAELVVIALWEVAGRAPPRVPRRFTDDLDR